MNNWKKVKLGSLLSESKVLSENPDPNKRIRVKLNVLGVEKRPNANDKEGATKYYIRKSGQFVYGKQNLHKGAFGIIPEELDGFESSLDIPTFDLDKSCYSEWVFYFFKSGNFYLKLETLAKGVGSKRIHPNQIYGLDIFLPSKEEQKSIIEKIKHIEQKHKDLLREIEKQENYVLKLRQSILQDAVQGQLTENWRKKNHNLEPASELIKRIESINENLVAEKKIKIRKPLPPIKVDEIPFEIPKSWEWFRLGDSKEIDTNISYGVIIPGSDIKDGIPLIRVSDLVNSKNGLLPEKYISSTIANKYTRTFIQGGEILITVVGSNIGKTVIAHENWKGANIARAIARLQVNTLLNSEFVYNCIISPYIQNIFSTSSRTIGQPTLNIGIVANVLIPVPPFYEQKEIVSKIKKLMIYCDKLDVEIKKSKCDAEFLMQTILIALIGEESALIVENQVNTKQSNDPKRVIKFDSKTTYMKLVNILQEHGKLHAEDLWKMSEFPNDIDTFYSELKKQIEDKKTIIESEKGYLELA